MIGPSLWLAAWLVYAAASLQWTTGSPALLSLWLVSLPVAYCIGAVVDVRRVWLAFFVLIVLSTCFALYQWYAWDFYAYGLAGNQNYMGCAIAIAIAAAISFDMLWFLPIGAFGLWWCLSRGAIVASAVAIIVGLWRRFPVASVALVFLCALVFLEAPPRDGSMFQRLGVWYDTLLHVKPWGWGYGSFQTAYASWPIHTNMVLSIAPHAYNDYLEMLLELGLGTVPFVIGVILCAEGRGPSRLVLLTFVLLSLTYFPLSVPILGQLFAFTLGHLAASRERSLHVALA